MTEQQYKITSGALQAEVNKLRADYLALVHENARLRNRMQMAEVNSQQINTMAWNIRSYLLSLKSETNSIVLSFFPSALLDYIEQLVAITHPSDRVKEIIHGHKKVV